MRFRCNRCGVWPQMYEFEADAPICQKCGAVGVPMVALLVDVHYLAPDPRGNVLTGSGRMKVACEPGRTHLATSSGAPWSATGEPSAVTCPRCKGSRPYLDAVQADEELRMAAAMERATRLSVVDFGKPCKGCP